MSDTCIWRSFKRTTLTAAPAVTPILESLFHGWWPVGLKPQKAPGNQSSLCPHTLLPLLPHPGLSAKCQKGKDTPSRSLSPASLGSKQDSLFSSMPPSDPLLQNEPQPGLQLFHVTNRIPFMVLRKVRGLRLILQGGTTCRPLPPKLQTGYIQGQTVFTVRLKMWQTSLASSFP